MTEPVPEMTGADAFAMLSPWIDAGKVGSLVLGALEAKFGALQICKLAQPGEFYDFTRYRPVMTLVEGRRRVTIPNTLVNYGVSPGGGNFVFVHGLEPHARGEYYVESMLEVLRRLSVRRHFLIGSMYDSVPHTRPLLVSGGSSDARGEADLNHRGVRRSNYQGPTTIMALLAEQAAVLGIETVTMLVRLPNYAQIEEDFMGVHRMLMLLDDIFGLSVATRDIKKLAEDQYQKLELAVGSNAQAGDMVKAMEENYDAETATPGEKQAFSPEIEKFLRDINKRFGSN